MEERTEGNYKGKEDALVFILCSHLWGFHTIVHEFLKLNITMHVHIILCVFNMRF